MAVEKGQKYKGLGSGDVYEILSDPFEFESDECVAFRVNRSQMINVQLAPTFLGDMYTLVVEPKYKIGDAVQDFEEEFTIEAVSKTPNLRDDFIYLVRNADNQVYSYDEPSLSKVSS